MTTLGKYELHEMLGKGGFGSVYRATDTSLGREVAIKVLHPQLMVDEAFVERFIKEAKVLASLDHPNIVTIHDMGEIDGRAFIVMRYLSGGSLQAKIQNEKRIQFEETKRIMTQVCDGLQIAHEKGLVHRDMKPANILFDSRDNAVISDFGLAKVVQMSGASSSIGVIGTPAYRAPELWRGKPPASPATDVYSLGCILVEMLTGKVLFDGATPDEILVQLMVDGPKLPENWSIDIPDKIQALIHQTLEKEIGKRPKDAHTFFTKLLQQEEGTSKTKEFCNGKNSDVINELSIKLIPGLNMEFVRIPPGTFIMGSNDGSVEEKPPHEVYLDEYWIGKYPVLNKEFHVYLNAHKIVNEEKLISNTVFEGKENYPVTNIDWVQAVKFCEWLSQLTNKKIRLPSESEWEKAARGNDQRRYPWGNHEPNRSRCNFNNNQGRIIAVGQFSPEGDSPFGCVDMAGNVCEWVLDWFDEKYYSICPEINPFGPKSEKEFRCLRGGSWGDGPDGIRVTTRICAKENTRNPFFGFRCVLTNEFIAKDDNL